ncbi:RraA family protein, partial [Singulisphaera rosea]
AGVEIRPGDLIHADKHGVCVIPLEVAAKLAEACAEVERMERPLLDICRSDDFTLDEYLVRRKAMTAKIRE